jgi:small subunit ribosomal protein S6
MRDYEAMIVIQPGLDDAGVTAVVTLVGDVVRRNGGEVAIVGQLADKKGHVVEVTESWNKRRLAYRIRGHLDAYYAVLRLNMPPEAVATVESAMTLNEDILRYLVTRIEDPPKVKA